jgi:hypothetical protein
MEYHFFFLTFGPPGALFSRNAEGVRERMPSALQLNAAMRHPA